MEKLLTYIAAVILLLADQATKFLARTGVITFDAGWFAFSYVTNTGAAFGLFTGYNSIFIIISVVALALLWYYCQPGVATAAITAGILGNLVDRVVHGHVIDFINFKIWPVFNIADACIVLGALWLIYVDFTEQ